VCRNYDITFADTLSDFVNVRYRDRTTALVLYDMVPEDMYDYCHDAGLFNSVLLPGEDPACVQRRVYALPPPPTNYHPQYEHAHYQY